MTIKANSSSSELILSELREQVEKVDSGLDTRYGCEDSFFVADLGSIHSQYLRFIEQLPNVTPLYAVKCNPDPQVLQLFANLGVGFDCASMSEIERVLKLGVPPERIIFANPCKQPSHLRFASSANVQHLTFDNFYELDKCREFYPNAKLLIRIVTDGSQASFNLSEKFGAWYEDSFKLVDYAKDLGLDVVGVAFHVGSGASDPHTFDQACKHARELFDYSETLGYKMSVLDVGGGFQHETFETFAAPLSQAIKAYKFETTRIIAEPGRYFVSNAFYLAAHVIGKRDKPDKAMVYLNDGLYANLNNVVFDHQTPVPKVLKSGMRRRATPQKVSLWGPTCDSIDCINADTTLPDSISPGDWVYFENVGAYTLCASTNFNGFNTNCKVHYVCSTPAAAKIIQK